jgi:transaldolase / glucose-6-phosphate isomerase
VDAEHTLFIASSKSGTTLETLCHYQHFFEIAPRGDQFVAVTDPGTPLVQIATDRDFRKIFLNQSDIGGRYSALSLVGLVPGAVLGVDLNELLDRAAEMACACHRCVPIEKNPGAWLGAVIGAAADNGRDKLTVLAPPEVSPLGDWVEQLIAESTGKQGRGIIPVVGEDLGPTDSYGQDRLFVSIGDVDGLDELVSSGHPVVQLAFRGSIDLGSEFFRWEFATAVSGHILGINPFDQPDVASAKQATEEILESGDFENPGLDGIEPLLSTLRPGDYVAIQAYLARNPETEQELQRVRLAIRDRYRVATTVGFGPRFLHSTGQLHKGGPNTGVFIQVVDEEDADVPIPHAGYTFRQLIDAQALADLRSLRRRERRIGRTTMDKLAEQY